MSEEKLHPQPAQGGPAPNGRRRRAMLMLALAVLTIGVGYGLYWALVARFRETTDDAYVSGNLVQITPQTPGTVVMISADDTDLVQAGEPVIVLDSSDAKVALDRAQSDLAQAVRQVRNLFVGVIQYDAAIRLRDVELKRAEADLKRRESVVAEGGVSSEEVQHAREAVAAAKAALSVAVEQRNGTESLIADTTIAQHPTVASAAARVRETFLAYRRTSIPSPVKGYVAKRSVQMGQRVSPGTPLMAVVPLEDLWVDANFKEVQVRHLRIGQPVKLSADLYGDKIEYSGKVVGLGVGTGSAFSLLPPQNATGNWIKVVQRVPVRIQLDARELAANPLQVGLSMEATIDTRANPG